MYRLHVAFRCCYMYVGLAARSSLAMPKPTVTAMDADDDSSMCGS
jgi:hypothetical protein